MKKSKRGHDSGLESTGAAAAAVPYMLEGAYGGGADEDYQEDAAPAAGSKRCNCKKARCLKLYCVCFAAGVYCSSCACVECLNTLGTQELVLKERNKKLQQSPWAFAPKVEQKEGELAHKKGCRCRRSRCIKKYCECYDAQVFCNAACRCEACRNMPEGGIAAPHAIPHIAAQQQQQLQLPPSRAQQQLPHSRAPSANAAALFGAPAQPAGLGLGPMAGATFGDGLVKRASYGTAQLSYGPGQLPYRAAQLPYDVRAEDLEAALARQRTVAAQADSGPSGSSGGGAGGAGEPPPRAAGRGGPPLGPGRSSVVAAMGAGYGDSLEVLDAAQEAGLGVRGRGRNQQVRGLGPDAGRLPGASDGFHPPQHAPGGAADKHCDGGPLYDNPALLYDNPAPMHGNGGGSLYGNGGGPPHGNGGRPLHGDRLEPAVGPSYGMPTAFMSMDAIAAAAQAASAATASGLRGQHLGARAEPLPPPASGGLAAPGAGGDIPAAGGSVAAAFGGASFGGDEMARAAGGMALEQQGEGASGRVERERVARRSSSDPEEDAAVAAAQRGAPASVPCPPADDLPGAATGGVATAGEHLPPEGFDPLRRADRAAAGVAVGVMAPGAVGAAGLRGPPALGIAAGGTAAAAAEAAAAARQGPQQPTAGRLDPLPAALGADGGLSQYGSGELSYGGDDGEDHSALVDAVLQAPGLLLQDPERAEQLAVWLGLDVPQQLAARKAAQILTALLQMAGAAAAARPAQGIAPGGSKWCGRRPPTMQPAPAPLVQQTSRTLHHPPTAAPEPHSRDPASQGHELVLLHALFGGRRAVVGLDLSHGMISLAERAIQAYRQQQQLLGQQAQARPAGAGPSLAPLDAVVADASCLDGRGPAAVVMSVFGLQQMGSAAPQALASWARALAPGGVCVVVLWPPRVEAAGPWTAYEQVDRLQRHKMEWESLDQFWQVMTEGGPWRARRLAQGDAAMADLRARFAAKYDALVAEYDGAGAEQGGSGRVEEGQGQLDGRPDGDVMQDALLEITGGRSVPRVFINGSFFGGGDDTAAAASNGKLQKLLTEAGAL
ncbi:Protein tesmin/TSO1-like CXC 2 [Tetrabaena socialis]|uniref:Protein tesmin/TSO1-like CXC 2 n=1 Tax=Tetrabaena socialis TaxID=47790 RepID=A0A2J8AEJ7_9CHLO|nr:Protein tesmin/TSO1-like CXC 2 [Tetrabaena socialis]|eukprot:PNH10932.1 Protein tesmin/TSO1-like CXC 2 [Tetrabaena socialis]